ncbi:MAG: REP-associated tyrosine transposase [Gammaproteobacteria bacterium]
MQYRRDYSQGATYFFTVVTFMRQPLFGRPETVDYLRQAIRQEMERRPFVIDAVVVMPDHLHALWSLPTGDADYSIRWRDIKRAFTARIPENQRAHVRGSRQHKHEQAIWQRRFWEHRIRDECDFTHHVEYIHYNPVKHGYVRCPADWPYSSIHRYIRQGILSIDRGASPIIIADPIGHE